MTLFTDVRGQTGRPEGSLTDLFVFVDGFSKSRGDFFFYVPQPIQSGSHVVLYNSSGPKKLKWLVFSDVKK